MRIFRYTLQIFVQLITNLKFTGYEKNLVIDVDGMYSDRYIYSMFI